MGYNLTAISQPNNAFGAGLSILTQVAAVAVIAGFAIGKRKRRDVGEEEESDFDILERSQLQESVIKILFDLDEFGCTAGAVCEASAIGTDTRNNQQQLLLSSLGISSGHRAAEWSGIGGAEGKYEFAAMVGRYSALAEREELCIQAFPDCPTSFDHVTNMLSSKSSCFAENNYLFDDEEEEETDYSQASPLVSNLSA